MCVACSLLFVVRCVLFVVRYLRLFFMCCVLCGLCLICVVCCVLFVVVVCCVVAVGVVC